jgi:putative transposase
LRHGRADADYRGGFLAWAKEVAGIAVQIAQRRDSGRRALWPPPGAEPPELPRFAVAPRRWVVERSFAWLGRYRRLAREYEYLTATSETVVQVAMIQLLLHRLTRQTSPFQTPSR